MEKKDTKQIILEEALGLFSERGYDTVSVEQIAAAVGIKAPSLYKHYKNKQDIFDTILSEMARRYHDRTTSLHLDGSNPQIDMPLYEKISEEQLTQMGTDLFLYFLHDDYVCKFRKLLTIEQYHSKALAALYAKQYVDEPMTYQSMLFGLLSQCGALKEENPEIMALHLYAPIYFLLTLCDRQPERESEALQILKQHIGQFNRLYQKEENKNYENIGN